MPALEPLHQPMLCLKQNKTFPETFDRNCIKPTDQFGKKHLTMLSIPMEEHALYLDIRYDCSFQHTSLVKFILKNLFHF
jgi:hypothetical protein